MLPVSLHYLHGYVVAFTGKHHFLQVLHAWVVLRCVLLYQGKVVLAHMQRLQSADVNTRYAFQLVA